MEEKPRTMEPEEAGKLLVSKLPDAKKPMTVADASVASGLALRDAEVGLTWLTHEYRGHLRVTEDGDLVHLFPHGFTKPWETREAWDRTVSAIGHGLATAGRFVVRAWLLIAMVGYAALFIALFIAMATAGGRDRDRGGGAGLIAPLFRAIGDALFWTFRPFSPVYIVPLDFSGGYGRHGNYPSAPSQRVGAYRNRVAEAPAPEEVPFYERVNRFVFGPREAPEDKSATRAKILAEIRAQRGRIGLADVMRVTGLPRAEADPLMARLMLDHDGTVEVADGGGIVYRFKELRRTADDPGAAPNARPRPAWESPKRTPPLTGNTAGQNLGIGALNLFNLLASSWVIANGLTIANILTLMSKHHPHVLTDTSTPIALGVVPLVFSIALFLLPLGRAVTRRFTEKRDAKENARLAIMREVLEKTRQKKPIDDAALQKVYRVATGEEPSSKEITRQVVDLGGDVETGPEGQVRYRFADFEAEAEALEEERAHAPADEAKLGKVVFRSDD